MVGATSEEKTKIIKILPLIYNHKNKYILNFLMLGKLSIEFDTYLFNIVSVRSIVATLPMGVTYYTITDAITNLHNKHPNFSSKLYLGYKAEV